MSNFIPPLGYLVDFLFYKACYKDGQINMQSSTSSYSSLISVNGSFKLKVVTGVSDVSHSLYRIGAFDNTWTLESSYMCFILFLKSPIHFNYESRPYHFASIYSSYTKITSAILLFRSVSLSLID